MSEEAKKADVLDYRNPKDRPPIGPFPWPKGIEWLWWSLLVISLAVGFGMTAFAPT